MNIISLATIKNQKCIPKMQYGQYLAASINKNVFNLKEIKASILDKDENSDFFYKVRNPLKLNKGKDIFFSNSNDDILNTYNDIVMERGHIYKFRICSMIYNDHNLNDIFTYDKHLAEQVINDSKNKILLEIIDLYNYLKDEMILYSEEFSSELGIKKSYILLNSEEDIKELINKNGIIIVKASKEVLNKALVTTRNEITYRALKEKEDWTSLKGSGYKSFKLYTDAYENYNKFKYENNYTEDLKTFLINSREEEIKEVIPELTNTKGNLVNERIGCFINLYDDLDKNKDYYTILKEAVALKTKENYEKMYNLNSQQAKEEVNNKIKTKALYIAKENMDDYILSSIKKKIIKKYISSKDSITSMMIKKGSEKVLDISKSEYIKNLNLSELKNEIVKDKNLDNLEESFYYFNDESSKDELNTLLTDKFNFHKESVDLFINNILNSKYYLIENDDEISNIIKLIDNKGYLFITYNEFADKLEDDLLNCLKYKQTGFEDVKDYIEKYTLIFYLNKIEELITSDNLGEIFGAKDRLLNLKEKLQKSDEDFTNMIPACEEILHDYRLIDEMLNSALFNTKDMEVLFKHYKELNGIEESVSLNDFFHIISGRSFITQEFAHKEKDFLKNGEYQGISIKVKYMSDEEYADKCKEIDNIESSGDFADYLLSKYYGDNLTHEEKKESLIKIQSMCNKITESTSLYKDSGIIDPFLYRIIQSNKSLRNSNDENEVNNYESYDINVILGYSQKSILHSANIEENDNLYLAHDIFKILTGAKLENHELIGGCEIAVNINNSKNPILPFYINAICNNIQSEEEEQYINNLLKRHIIFENENIQKVNGRYKLIENLRDYYSKNNITYGFAKIIDNIMNSFVNAKMKAAITEIKENNCGMMDICVTNNTKPAKLSNSAQLNYEYLQVINMFKDNIYKESDSYSERKLNSNIIDNMIKRYLDYMLQNEGFIYNMEQCANLNIALIAKNSLSIQDSEKLYNNTKGEDSYGHNKSDYEKRLKKAEIRDITIHEAVADKGFILPNEMGDIFRDIIIKGDYEEKVNAYRINIENFQLDNPLYKDLFTKDINNRYVYEHLSSNYDPKQYAQFQNIKSKISEIIIPAFNPKTPEEDVECNLESLKKKCADLINTLYELDKYNNEDYKVIKEKEIHMSKKIKNEVLEDNLLIKLKNKAQKKLTDYYESLVYEMTDSKGYFKKSLSVLIENSANLKVSSIAAPLRDNDGSYTARMFKKAIDVEKYHGIHYVNPKDMFGKNYKSAYKTIGKQLITDNLDKSDKFYKYMKKNFLKGVENISDIRKKGKDLLKDNSILEQIGEGYLKEIGISSMLIGNLDGASPTVQFVKTYINSNVSEGATHIDYVSGHKFLGDEIKVFFEGIRKSENGKYFLRSSEEIQDIYDIMRALENNNYKEFKNECEEYRKDKIKSCDISELKEISTTISEEGKNSNYIIYNKKTDILTELLKKQRRKVRIYNYCLKEGITSYFEGNKDSRANLSINRDLNYLTHLFEKSLKDYNANISYEHVKQSTKICDNYINNMSTLCDLKASTEHRAQAMDNLKCDTFLVSPKDDSKVSIEEIFKSLNKIIEDPKANKVIHENLYGKGFKAYNERNKLPFYKKVNKACEILINNTHINKKGIYREICSRNYAQHVPIIDGKKVLKGSRIYSVNVDDMGFFRVLDTRRNKKGNAELKLQDIQNSKIKTVQGKSFDHISKKINYYKIAPKDKTNEIILNEIKESIKKEYINDFSRSFEMADKIFNNIQSDNSLIENQAFKEIRKEYDKDKVRDYVNTIQVLKHKNMLTKDEISNMSNKMNEAIKKAGKSKKEYKENLFNALKNSRKFKERNIDTAPKVEKFLKSIITRENIENARTMEAVKKAEDYSRVNINEVENILTEDIQTIIKDLSIKDENTYEIGRDIVKTYINHIQEEDKNNEQILNEVYKENAHNPKFLDKALNINKNSLKNLESIKKVMIGYGSYAGLSIGELSHKSLNEILKKDYADKLNYKVNKKLLNKTKDVINKAKYLDKECIINKEGKIITKEKLQSRLGNSYINKIQKSMNEKIKEKGKYRRKESNMYNDTSQAIKSALTSKFKDSQKILVMRKSSNSGSILSSTYSAQNINIEPNIIPKLKENRKIFSESIDSSSTNYDSIPKSDTRYYSEQATGNAINISAQYPSKSTMTDMSKLISNALGGSNLRINANYSDSRSMVTKDEINSMIENSIK